MPQQIIFPCPSCGATMSADEGAWQTQCQFCGNTAQVPAGLRGPAAPTRSPAPAGAGPLAVAYHDRLGRPAVLNYQEFKVIADAVRAGDKTQAAALFQPMFGVSQAEAQQAIDTLSAGQMITLGTTAGGGPMALSVAKVAPPAPILISGTALPDAVGAYNSVGDANVASTSYPNSPIQLSPPINTGSGLFRLNLVAAGCGVLAAVVFGCGLPIILTIPSLLPSLAHMWTQLTGR